MAQAIDVRGLNQTYRALREVDPQLSRLFYKDLGGMLKTRVLSAKSRMPVRSGRPAGTYGIAQTTRLTKAGSKYAKTVGGRGRRGLFGFVAVTGVGHANILDLAQQAHSPQGTKLIQTLNAKYGAAPRFLGREFLGDANRRALYAESEKLVGKYVGELNRIIERNAMAS